MKNKMKLLAVAGLTSALFACGSGSGGGTPSNRAPTASFNTNCTEFACNFFDTSTDSDGSVAGVTWDFGDGNTSTEATPTHTYAGYGTYTIKLTVTDNSGSTGVTTETLLIVVDVHTATAVIDMNHASVIFKQDFDHRVDGLYDRQELADDFGCAAIYNAVDGCGGIRDDAATVNVDEMAIESGEMKVTFTEDLIGSAIGFYKNLGADYNELYLTFTVRFDENYDQTTGGGKLMGLAADHENFWAPVGCSTVVPDEGFSARYTYRREGQLTQYIYHQDKTDVCGDNRYILDTNDTTTFKYRKGQTYTMEMRVKMNTPGEANGVMETKINGVLLRTDSDFMFSEAGTYGINQFLFALYIGGKEDSFKLLNPSTLYLDNFVLSTESVVN